MKRLAILGVALTAMGAAATAQLVEDGLVGYWPLDPGNFDGATAEDVWGDNDGTVTGDVVEVDGAVGGAAEFDGLSGIEIPGTDALNFVGADELSALAWVNADSDEPVMGVVAGCCGTIVAQRDAEGWAMRFDGRNAGMEMEFIVHSGGGWAGDGGFGAPKFAAGEWHHIGVTMGDGALRYFLDGDFLTETAIPGTIESLGPETEIGVAGDGGFIGLIDEVMIYNRALNDNEMRANFEAQGLSVDAAGKAAVRWAQLKTAR